MTPFYPIHVKIMFEIISFVNMDFPYLSSLFTKYSMIDKLKVPSYDSHILERGIDSPLFLQNCSSLLMSLLLTLLLLSILGIAYGLVK